jgi:hypothetical protein
MMQPVSFVFAPDSLAPPVLPIVAWRGDSFVKVLLSVSVRQ